MAAGTKPRRRRAGLSTHRSSFSWGRHRTLLAFLVVLGFFVSGTSGVVAYFLPAVTTALHVTGHATTGKGGTHGRTGSGTVQTANPPPPGQPFTVLLLGSDNDTKFPPSGVLTQTMILVRVDPQTHHAVMFSIPRDLWVPIASGGSAKIDAAYAYGGARDAVQTVQNDFNVAVNYWAWIGLGGLVTLVNQLPGGGVDLISQMPILDVQYPYDLTGNNPYANQRIAILPGPQRLNGVNALTYVRSRHGDILEDIARSQKQQELLVAIKDAAKHLNLADIPRIASSLGNEVATSLTPGQIGSIASLAKDFSTDNVTQIVMVDQYQGQYYTSETVSSQAALVPNWSAINALVAQNFPA
ncbi:MAG: LCP family protein [Candidatus Dormibacteria bacterium]